MSTTPTLKELSLAPPSDSGAAAHAIETLRDVLEHSDRLDASELKITQSGSVSRDTHTDSSDLDLIISQPVKPAHGKNRRLQTHHRMVQSLRLHSDMLRTLADAIGREHLQVSRKSIKILGHDDFPETDILPCLQLENGIEFWIPSGNAVRRWQKILSDPEAHGKAIKNRAERSGGASQQVTRILKRSRDSLADEGHVNPNQQSSFHIEALVDTVPVEVLEGGNHKEILRILLHQAHDPAFVDKAKVPNGNHRLFGNRTVQWDPKHARQLLRRLPELLKVSN